MPELDLTELVNKADEQSRTETAKPVKDRARALPSPHRDEITERMRTRVQINFSNVPVPIKEAFMKRARELGFKWPAHYLYHLMRLDGLDVPDPDSIDGRSR